MSSRLPEYIDPLRLAEARAVLQGQFAIAGMRRLASALHSTQGVVDVDLEFGIDEARTPYVKGVMRAGLEVVCQRCLGPMVLPVEVELALGIVTSAQEVERLPGNYDPLLVEAEPVSLADVIEDELILALPVAPVHPEQQCPPWRDTVVEQPAEKVGKPSPFAVLAQLKDKKQ